MDVSGAKNVTLLHFMPLHLVDFGNEHGTKRRRRTVIIELPSGLGVGNCSVYLSEGGRELELSVFWTDPLHDL